MKFVGAVFLTILLVILISVAWRCYGAEGFMSGGAEDDAGTLLMRMLSSAQRIGTYLADPANWTEQVRRARMTPIEMAREYLKAAAS
jgi:hypothetical protein